MELINTTGDRKLIHRDTPQPSPTRIRSTSPAPGHRPGRPTRTSPLLGNSASPRPQRSISPPAYCAPSRRCSPRRCSAQAEMKSTRNAIRTTRRHSMISAGRRSIKLLLLLRRQPTVRLERSARRLSCGRVCDTCPLLAVVEATKNLFVCDRDGAQPQSSTPY